MSRRRTPAKPPAFEQWFVSPQITQLFAASTPVRHVFRLEAQVFRVADALLLLYAEGAAITAEEPRRDETDVARMWSASTRRRSRATLPPVPGDAGGETVVALADVSIDASQHPYDGDGWRIGIAISRDRQSSLWLDASSHASQPGFLVRTPGPPPAGLCAALRQGFTITP